MEQGDATPLHFRRYQGAGGETVSLFKLEESPRTSLLVAAEIRALKRLAC